MRRKHRTRGRLVLGGVLVMSGGGRERKRMLSRPKHVIQKGKVPPTGSGPGEAKNSLGVAMAAVYRGRS